ncbi:uncharacterized protein [Gorilla gorilla gorilla]|uniref:uncharacterized protein isoform X1 n=1 Tax=Gorilla gorilla gorilla TaxID=9595 RepID=UPI00300AAD5C
MLEAGAAGARLASLRLSAVTERDQRGWSGDVLHLFNLICSLPCRPVDEEPESSKPNTAQLRRLLSYQEQVLPKCFLKIMRHLGKEGLCIECFMLRWLLRCFIDGVRRHRETPAHGRSARLPQLRGPAPPGGLGSPPARRRHRQVPA